MKEAIVTGAGGALGQVVAKHLHDSGLHVHAVYRQKPADTGDGIDSYTCDLSSAHEVQGLCERFLADRSVAIVNCAGGFAWNKTSKLFG